MKIREFIKQEIDIDVADDVCDELYIAFCGPLELTPDGEAEFAEVLDYDIEIHDNGHSTVGIVHVDAPEGVWQKRLSKAKKFFDSAAGYCSCSDYEKWFKEDDD